MSRLAERRARAEAFEAALRADWLGQDYGGHTTCCDCDSFAYQRGPSPRKRRCLSCHAKQPVVRRRVRRRVRV